MQHAVVWSSFAEEKIDAIYEYYKFEAGHRVAIKLIAKLISSRNKLSKTPNIGTIVPLLTSR